MCPSGRRAAAVGAGAQPDTKRQKSLRIPRNSENMNDRAIGGIPRIRGNVMGSEPGLTPYLTRVSGTGAAVAAVQNNSPAAS
jgi:hypothetical protein